jgi:hypothetical protein
MKRRGCKPKGSALVEHLDGSLQAKERLEVILETLAGRLTIEQACGRLGVKEARFHRLRTTMLEAGLARLEPRSAGRPRHDATAAEIRGEKLEREVAELQSELKIAAMREEIARAIPNLFQANASLKKTTEWPNGRR